MMYTWDITPIGAPRLNRFDQWKKRPRVLRYFEFRDAIAKFIEDTPIKEATHIEVNFHIPMPRSWSKKKKALLCDTPHQQKPDIDNLVKALLDSIHRGGDDSKVYSIIARKYWSIEGKIRMTI